MTATVAVAPPERRVESGTATEAVGPAVRWWQRPGLVVPVAVGVTNLVLRLPRLASPSVLVFDEVYYAPDASDLLRWGIEQGDPVHPPLGKWLIAAGIRLFGFTPFGWRIAGVVAGALVCALVASAAWKLTRRWELAVLGGMLCGLDGIVFTASRVAMLDIFVGLFVTAAVWCAISAWGAQPDHRKVRYWGLGALAAVGLGCGVKWAALAVLPVVLVELLVLDRRLAPPGRPRWLAMLGTVGAALVIPTVLYLGAYVPTFLTNGDLLGPHNFISEQASDYRFHSNLEPKNPYAQPAYTWFAQAEPAALFRQRCEPDQANTSVTCPRSSHATEARILSVANPVVWLAGVVAGAALIVIGAWKRDLRALLVVALGLTQWVPWLVFSRPPYSFYLASLLPIMALWVPAAIGRLPSRRSVVPTTAGILGLAAVAMFVFLYPLWTALPISPSAMDQRLLLDSWP